MSVELTITAEFIEGLVLLTVEHGNADRVQTLRLSRPDMLAAMATVQLAMATNQTAAAHYPHGI